MAKAKSNIAATEHKIEGFAEDLGKMLGHARNKAEGWMGQRKAIVKSFSAVPNGWTSLKPMVVMVVTVWYAASRSPKPSTVYPTVPTTNTAARASPLRSNNRCSGRRSADDTGAIVSVPVPAAAGTTTCGAYDRATISPSSSMSIRSGRRERSDRSKAQVSLGEGGASPWLFRELTDDVVLELAIRNALVATTGSTPTSAARC